MMRTAKTIVFDTSKTYDVLIIGGGNAGLCAAIMAHQAGASVLLLEQAPKDLRGGNSRHARNLRVRHDMPDEFVRDAYRDQEYWDDLARVTGGNMNKVLARTVIDNSAHLRYWMANRGVRFQSSHSALASHSRKTAFLLGGGKALLNAYYLTAERRGVEILYEAEVLSLHLDNGSVRAATATVDDKLTEIRAKSVVVASGGFQANIDWLRRYWGEAADHFLIRGTSYAKGQILKDLLDQGVAPIGDPAQCHIVAIDARAPKFDGGIVTRLDCVPFGIVVDRDGRRFHDEGAEVGPERYAVWGKLVAQRPDQIAYAIFDANAELRFRPSIYPAICAQTIAELAGKLGLDPPTLIETVTAFNTAIRSNNGDEPADWQTKGVTPPKTRWAQPIERPPFSSYPLRPGITFTYLGVKIDERARVLMTDGRPSRNLFAAGAIMAANIVGQGYLAGIGLTIGSVFGQIAGREAAKYAQH